MGEVSDGARGRLSYDVVDVFTDRAFAGNPLAVVHGGRGLTTAQMQALAASSTCPRRRSRCRRPTPDADYRLRIFTPAVELPFAGHPSVGVGLGAGPRRAHRPGAVVQECGAGLLPVRVDADGRPGRPAGSPQVGRPLDAAALRRGRRPRPGRPRRRRAGRVRAAGVRYAFVPVRPDAVARCEVPAARRALAGRDRAAPG